MKKGQLAVFMLLGIVLLVAVFLVVFTVQDSALKVQEWAKPTVTAFGSCVERQSQSALRLQLARGGMVYPSRPVNLGFLRVGLAADSEGYLVPDIESMEQDMEFYLSSLVESCVDEVKNLVPGVTIEPAEAEVQAIYSVGGVTLTVDVPLMLRKGSLSQKVSPVVVNIDSDAPLLLRSAAENISRDVYLEGALPLEILAADYSASVITAGYGYSVITLSDDGYVFNFAVKEPAKATINVAPLRLEDDLISVPVGVITKRQLELSGEPPYLLESNLPWFKVSEEGVAVIDTTGVVAGKYIGYLDSVGDSVMFTVVVS